MSWTPLGRARGARGVELDHVVLRVGLEQGVVMRRGFNPRVMPLVAFAVEAERDHPRLRGERGDGLVREVGDIRANEHDPRLAILKEAGDLRRGEAKVEWGKRHSRLAGAEQAGQEMIGIFAEICDPLLRPDAGRDERVGDPRGHRVHPREGHRLALEHERGLAATTERLHARHIRHGGYAFELDHCVSAQDRTAMQPIILGHYARLAALRNPCGRTVYALCGAAIASVAEAWAQATEALRSHGKAHA